MDSNIVCRVLGTKYSVNEGHCQLKPLIINPHDIIIGQSLDLILTHASNKHAEHKKNGRIRTVVYNFSLFSSTQRHTQHGGLAVYVGPDSTHTCQHGRSAIGKMCSYFLYYLCISYFHEKRIYSYRMSLDRYD